MERGDSRGSPSVVPASQLPDTRLLDVGIHPAVFGSARCPFESFVTRLPHLINNRPLWLPLRNLGSTIWYICSRAMCGGFEDFSDANSIASKRTPAAVADRMHRRKGLRH